MPNAFDILFRLILFTPLVIGLMLVGITGYNYGTETVHEAVTQPAWDGAEDAYGTADEENARTAIMEFTAISIMALLLVAGFWLIYGDLTGDVRQRRTDFRRLR